MFKHCLLQFASTSLALGKPWLARLGVSLITETILGELGVARAAAARQDTKEGWSGGGAKASKSHNLWTGWKIVFHSWKLGL